MVFQSFSIRFVPPPFPAQSLASLHVLHGAIDHLPRRLGSSASGGGILHAASCRGLEFHCRAQMLEVVGHGPHCRYRWNCSRSVNVHTTPSGRARFELATTEETGSLPRLFCGLFVGRMRLLPNPGILMRTQCSHCQLGRFVLPSQNIHRHRQILE